MITLLGTGSIAAVPGCFSNEKQSKPNKSNNRSGEPANIDTNDSPDLEDNDIYSDARRLVESIREDKRELERSGNSPFRAQVYLGGINNYDSITAFTFTVNDEETVERYKNISEDEILADIREEGIISRYTNDPVEPPLLLENEATIDVFYFQTESDLHNEIEFASENLERDLRSLLSQEYDVNVTNYSTHVDEPVTEADPRAEEHLSEYDSSHLQMVITEAELEVDGFTYKDGNRAYVQARPTHKDNTGHLAKIMKHEAYHSVLDLPHTAYNGHLLSLREDSMEISERNTILAERYLSSEIDLATETGQRGEQEIMEITVDYQPQFEYPREKDREETFQHLEKYLEDHKYFDTGPWRRAEYNPNQNIARYEREIDQGELELIFNMDNLRYFENVELNAE